MLNYNIVMGRERMEIKTMLWGERGASKEGKSTRAVHHFEHNEMDTQT